MKNLNRFKQSEMILNDNNYAAQLEEICLSIKSYENLNMLKTMHDKGYPFLHVWSDQSTLLDRAIEYNNPKALDYLLNNIDWLNVKNVYECNDRLYYKCISKSTGQLNKELATILVKYIPLEEPWKIYLVFENLTRQNDMESISFLINRGINIFKNESLNNEKNFTSDYSLLKCLVLSEDDNLKLCKYISENHCKWNDTLFLEPVLYNVIKSVSLDEISPDSFTATIFKEKMFYFIDEGCSLDKRVNYLESSSPTVKEFLLDIIKMDVDDEDKDAYFKMYTEINAYYEKKKINENIIKQDVKKTQGKRL